MLVKRLLFVGKVGISALLIWIVATAIDLSSALVHLTSLNGLVAAAALGLITVQFVVAGCRQSAVLRFFGNRYSFLASIWTILIGAFFSQTFLSFLGGDAMRVWRITQHGIGLRTAVSAILLDRAMGFIALMFLIVVGLPQLLSIVVQPAMRWSVMLLALGGVASTAVFVLLGVLFGLLPARLLESRIFGAVADLSSVSRHALDSPGRSVYVLLLSLGIHLVNVLVIFTLARGFGVGVGMFEALILIPPVVLISLVPISIAGWGVREGVMVLAFGLLGFPADRVLAVSVAFGLALAVASLPGGVLWLINRRQRGNAGVAVTAPGDR